jgi:hypothetical protein
MEAVGWMELAGGRRLASNVYFEVKTGRGSFAQYNPSMVWLLHFCRKSMCLRVAICIGVFRQIRRQVHRRIRWQIPEQNPASRTLPILYPRLIADPLIEKMVYVSNPQYDAH